MKKKLVCLLILPFLATLSANSQYEDGGIKEIEYVRDSILKIHRNDEFYFHIRYLPDVRTSIEDYTLSKVSNQWICKHYKTTFNPPAWEGTDRTPRKRILNVSKLDNRLMASFLKSIDVDKLMNFKNSDSISISNSFIREGTDNYFIIICTKGKVRLIEYPIVKHIDRSKNLRKQNIFWQSKYLNNLIAKFKQAF